MANLDPSLRNFSITDLPDTLEIIDYREDGSWCLLDGRYRFGSNRIALTEVIRQRREGVRHVPGRDTWLQIDQTPLSWLHGLGPERIESSTGRPNTIRLTRGEMMAVSALVPKIAYPTREDVRTILRRRLSSEMNDDLIEGAMPPHLRRYQRQGLTWLYHLHGNGVGRVLADDTGLGQDPPSPDPAVTVGQGKR